MTTEGTPPHDDKYEEDKELQERLALPLLLPAAIFLFGVLTIYGLSRIYLELNQWKKGDVSMATPLAIGIALTILVVCTVMASRRTLARGLLPMILLLAVAGLTAGAIWAAVHEDPEVESAAASPTPSNGGTPAPPGTVAVGLHDPEFAVSAAPETEPAGSVTFHVENEGTIIHNFRVIKTDLAPDALPIDQATFAVAVDQVDIVAEGAELDAGTSEDVVATLDEGSYVLICNVPTHYESGMHAAFSVGPPPGGP